MAPNDGVAEPEVAILALTPFFSQSQLYGSVRGYQFDDPDGFETYHEGRATTIETVPMLLVSVSLMALLDNTSGHLQLELLRVDQPRKMPVLVMLVAIDITIPPFVGGDYFCESGGNFAASGSYVRMTSLGWQWTEVTVAHPTILHALLSGSPILPLMIMRPDCAVGSIVLYYRVSKYCVRMLRFRRKFILLTHA